MIDLSEEKQFVLNSLRKCVIEKRDLDKKLEQLIKPYLKDNMKILDLGCGIGHISYFLSQLNPSMSFYGIDKHGYLIKEAKKLCKDINGNFVKGDVNKLKNNFPKHFDLSICWRVLSWTRKYEDIMRNLFMVTRKTIFLSSLFYDGNIDFEIKVKEYRKEKATKDFNEYWNVYSYPRFERFVRSLGAKKIQAYDFEIKKDLSKPHNDVMGSYTIKLENGKRLQVSGVIILNWKIIRIDL